MEQGLISSPSNDYIKKSRKDGGVKTKSSSRGFRNLQISPLGNLEESNKEKTSSDAVP